jgi:hypothetical protein
MNFSNDITKYCTIENNLTEKRAEFLILKGWKLTLIKTKPRSYEKKICIVMLARNLARSSLNNDPEKSSRQNFIFFFVPKFLV